MSSERDGLPRTGIELRDWLLTLLPEFAPGYGNGWRYEPDGSLTPHHVCSELTDYYLRQVSDYDAPSLIEMFRVMEVINAADPADFDPISNALCTCFLENIAYSEAGEAGKVHMGPASRRYFDGWHRGYVPRA